MRNYRNMSNDTISKRIKELSNILDSNPCDERWEEAYDEYCELNSILDERYRKENQSKFDAFYERHIKDKRWEEIRPEDWDFYSDWHKDMYGYRPKAI